MTAESKEVILLGELNVNYLKADENREIKSILKLYGFKQLIKKATRITMETATLIDIIATNNQAAISCCDVIPSSLSDHDMVGCSRKIHSFKYGPRTIVCRNYAKYDPKEMVKDVKNIDWEPFYQSTCVNPALD